MTKASVRLLMRERQLSSAAANYQYKAVPSRRFDRSSEIHDICKEHQMPVWCGGMFETGISRAHNLALSSLPQFLIPGDLSSSSRYWEEDIVNRNPDRGRLYSGSNLTGNGI
ncbi:hypothetical protein PO124_18095 [Bacillus licheniformis]|nr:hypothetical protein [Bacillus licheniformis]